MARISPMTARRGMFEITPETFNGIEEAIRWAEGVGNRLARGQHMDIVGPLHGVHESWNCTADVSRPVRSAEQQPGWLPGEFQFDA